ncbi:MAG: DinB family protein [Anaerolineaceae bacterium]|jgi:hypothetical protein|nr:DinB family protein [Anaerolineaceae bacterium]
MNKTIPAEKLSKEIMDILEETFETHHGVYLDEGTTLFDTLEPVSAEEASVPAGMNGSSIAAQLEHVIFYLDVLGQVIAGQEVGKLDWREIWERVGAVTPEEWDDLKARLKAAYKKTSALLQGIENWEENDAIGGAIAILVHTAYHLGEIRQTLYTIGRTQG